MRRDVLAHLSGRLTLCDDASDGIEVSTELRSGVLFQELRRLPEDHGHDFGKIALAFEEAELNFHDSFELLRGARGARQLLLEKVEKALDVALEQRHEQSILRLEVQVDGAIGDARGTGHVTDACRMKAAAREDPNGGVEDAFTLVTARSGGPPPPTSRTE